MHIPDEIVIRPVHYLVITSRRLLISLLYEGKIPLRKRFNKSDVARKFVGFTCQAWRETPRARRALKLTRREIGFINRVPPGLFGRQVPFVPFADTGDVLLGHHLSQTAASQILYFLWIICQQP